MVDRPNKPGAISAPGKTVQPHVEISADSSRVTARLPTGESVEVLLHGATVLSWKSANGQENLWLSDKAILDGTKAVRGGIPVVFPVFGPPPADHATSALPQHGFARNSTWEYLGKSSSESASSSKGANDETNVKLDFGLYSAKLDAKSRAAWPHDFGLVYSVTLSRDSLQTMLNVSNEGKEPFEFQMLLHSYFRIKDISQTTLTGLLGVSYIDKVLNATTHTEQNTALPITGETDRVYPAIPQSTTSILEAGKPRFDVTRDNLADTVVWNPWSAKSAAMADFAPADGWREMVCVEVGCVEGWTRLDSGETFEGGQIVKAVL